MIHGIRIRNIRRGAEMIRGETPKIYVSCLHYSSSILLMKRKLEWAFLQLMSLHLMESLHQNVKSTSVYLNFTFFWKVYIFLTFQKNVKFKETDVEAQWHKGSILWLAYTSWKNDLYQAVELFKGPNM